MSSGGFSVFRKGDCGNRLTAGEILPLFWRFKGRVASVTAKVRVSGKEQHKSLCEAVL